MKLSHAPGRKVSLTLAFALVVGLVAAARAKTVRRITLPPPGQSVRIEGKLRGMEDRKQFVFDGRSGTKVKIDLSGAGPLRGEVLFPLSGREGGPGGRILDQALPDTGQYRITISESSMGETWHGKFTIAISVAR